MDQWRKVWRNGLCPQLSEAGLEALRQALQRDDQRLAQGYTTSPPSLDVFADSDVEAACALGFCGWQGEGLTTVAEVTDYYQRLCAHADERLGEPGACRFFLNWFDEMPRAEVRRQLLAEVNRALKRRLARAA